MSPMIPIEMIIRNNPLLWVGISLICLFVIIPIVVSISDCEWFRREAIEVKYCYHWDKDTIQAYCCYTKGNRLRSFEKAYWMLAYYYTPDSLFPNVYRPVIEDSDFQLRDCIYKVEVLRYSEDSLLATIRYNYPTSGSFLETVSVVPSFTLHDTLPTGYEAENEGYMKDIMLKKPNS